jgi:GTPase SAR1 family protein
MMDQPLRFAIVGTPNVGKSSVISTLTEDDKVPISPTPGETTACRTYPITIDGGQPIIEFIDTPGFQNPRSTLDWLEEHDNDEAVSFFRAEHSELEAFRHDNELLRPIVEGAGVIYVVDGSCPISGDNRAEMEILGRSGVPRVASINMKEDNRQYLPNWKMEFSRHFNIVWEFNAHRACFAERIALLEALKGIKQEWQPAIDQAVSAIRADWEKRLHYTSDIICSLLEKALSYHDVIDCDENNQKKKEKELQNRFCGKVVEIEHDFHEQIRSLFKHNIFNYQPPPDSALRRKLFSKEVWQVLGLNRTQLSIAAAALGAGVGVGLDALCPGLSFGIFTTGMAAAGAASAYFYGDDFARLLRPSGHWRLLWPHTGRTQLQIGPLYDLQFFFVLLDRVLIFLPYVINWAHGRREPPPSNIPPATPEGYAARWPEEWRKHAINYFKALKNSKEKEPVDGEALQRFQSVLMEVLNKISNAQEDDIFASSESQAQQDTPAPEAESN